MKIVNINDIEDLILAKHEIDLMLIEDKVIDVKTTINDFITKYAIPNYIYVVNGVNIPFKLFIIHNNKYLFVTNNNKEEIDILQNKIKLLKYDMNNLIELKTEDMFNMTDPMHDNFIIINNKYYK
jgi:hypothetical protein